MLCFPAGKTSLSPFAGLVKMHKNGKTVILQVSGHTKSPIVKRLLETDISAGFPASIIKDHKNAFLLIDFEASHTWHTIYNLKSGIIPQHSNLNKTKPVSYFIVLDIRFWSRRMIK